MNKYSVQSNGESLNKQKLSLFMPVFLSEQSYYIMLTVLVCFQFS